MDKFYQKQKNKKYRNCGSQIGASPATKESETNMETMVMIPEPDALMECSTALLNQHKRILSGGMGEPFKEVGNMFFENLHLSPQSVMTKIAYNKALPNVKMVSRSSPR